MHASTGPRCRLPVQRRCCSASDGQTARARAPVAPSSRSSTRRGVPLHRPKQQPRPSAPLQTDILFPYLARRLHLLRQRCSARSRLRSRTERGAWRSCSVGLPRRRRAPSRPRSGRFPCTFAPPSPSSRLPPPQVLVAGLCFCVWKRTTSTKSRIAVDCVPVRLEPAPDRTKPSRARLQLARVRPPQPASSSLSAPTGPMPTG